MASTLSGLPPELTLLIQCARTRLDAPHIAAIQASLKSDLDWALLLQMARQHYVTALLYRSLKTVNSPHLPNHVQQSLQTWTQTNLRRNLFLTAELIKLLNLFKQHHISAIPYKGPVLAAAAYGDLSLRQFADLDILVSLEDVLKVKAILLQRNYQAECQLTPGQEVAHLKSGCEYNFYNPALRLQVEIHWRIVRPYFTFPLNLEQLWNELVPIEVGNVPIHSLSLETLLLVLCVHNGGKHHWERLSWICDVAELLRRHPHLNWNQLFEQAHQLGVARLLNLALFIAHDLLGAPVPPAIWQRLQSDPILISLSAQMVNQLFQGAHRPTEGLAYHLTTLKMRERWRDRLKYSCRLPGALTLDDLLFTSLSPKLSWLYHVVRPIRLATKFVKF